MGGVQRAEPAQVRSRQYQSRRQHVRPGDQRRWLPRDAGGIKVVLVIWPLWDSPPGLSCAQSAFGAWAGQEAYPTKILRQRLSQHFIPLFRAEPTQLLA